MADWSPILGGVLSLLFFGSLAGWFFWRWSQRSVDAPHLLIIKIVVTLGFVFVAVLCMLKISPFIGVPLAALFGVIIGGMWGRNIGTWIASPFSSIYDGGFEEEAPRPFYAIAHAHRKQGRFAESIRVIQEQLEKFPEDPEGWLMLAEIRARNLSDWKGAAADVEQVAGNVSLAVPTRVRALVALADWHLDLANNSAAARALFQRILDEFPGTAEAAEAAQRLAHVGTGDWRREKHAPTLLKLKATDQRLGLRTEPLPKPEEPDPELEIRELVKHLGAHPTDAEARERLALLYADRLGRVDWARAEIERGLAEKNVPAKHVAHWLHLLADIEVRCGTGEVGARSALERIEKLFPDSALAANARSRLERLRLEIKGKNAARTVGGAS